MQRDQSKQFPMVCQVIRSLSDNVLVIEKVKGGSSSETHSKDQTRLHQTRMEHLPGISELSFQEDQKDSGHIVVILGLSNSDVRVTGPRNVSAVASLLTIHQTGEIQSRAESPECLSCWGLQNNYWSFRGTEEHHIEMVELAIVQSVVREGAETQKKYKP